MLGEWKGKVNFAIDGKLRAMTPELWKEIIIGSVTVLCTAFFTGVPALLLFWWTWRRDQERLKVQKLVWMAHTTEGKLLPLRDNVGPQFGILVRNLSLFPVRVSDAAFEIDGELIELDRVLFPSKTKVELGEWSYVQNQQTPNLREIGSQSYTRMFFGKEDRNRLSVALLVAAERYHDSIEHVLTSDIVSVVVVTETGRRFSSLSAWKRFIRKLLAGSSAIS